MAIKREIPDGERLKQLLKEVGWRQNELSEKTGIHRVTVHRLLKQISLGTDQIRAIMKAMGKETWEFFITPDELAKHCRISEDMLEIARNLERLPPDVQDKIIERFSGVIEDALFYLKRR